MVAIAYLAPNRKALHHFIQASQLKHLVSSQAVCSTRKKKTMSLLLQRRLVSQAIQLSSWEWQHPFAQVIRTVTTRHGPTRHDTTECVKLPAPHCRFGAAAGRNLSAEAPTACFRYRQHCHCLLLLPLFCVRHAISSCRRRHTQFFFFSQHRECTDFLLQDNHRRPLPFQPSTLLFIEFDSSHRLSTHPIRNDSKCHHRQGMSRDH